jgi:NADH pyrophosphatase NudC (nudix superfamily)
MANLLDGLVKGLSGFLPQDDPDVKIMNAQAELNELAEKEEKMFARLGRQVYTGGSIENCPGVKVELDLLVDSRRAAERRLQEAREEKEARERAAAAETPAPATARFCSNCGAELTPGHRFCAACGTKIDNS